jgi:hypothetical protein
MSVMGTAHLGQDGAMRFMLGLRGYIGPDPDKSLIRRHREDDPSDRAVGLMTAVGSANLRGNPSASGGSTPHDSTSDSGDKDSNNNTTPSAPTSFDDCMAAGLGLGYCFGLFPNG